MTRTYYLTRLTERTDDRSAATVSILREDYRGRQSCVARVWSDGSCDVASGARWLLADLRKDMRGINPNAHRDVADTGAPLTVEA